MAVKLIRDPEALERELNEAHARNRDLSKQVSSINKERKEFQKAKAEAAEAVEALKVAEKDRDIAVKRAETLENELESERDARAAERKMVEAAQSIKRAFEAL